MCAECSPKFKVLNSTDLYEVRKYEGGDWAATSFGAPPARVRLALVFALILRIPAWLWLRRTCISSRLH